MNERFRNTFALLALSALAACGSPADNTSFKPPPGWSSTPGIMGRFQMWIGPSTGTDRHLLMLIRGDQSMTLSDTNQPWNQQTHLQTLKQSTIRMCGGEQVQYFVGEGESVRNGGKHEERVEGVLNPIGGSKYLAFYIRPLTAPADPQAEAALRSVCPAPK